MPLTVVDPVGIHEAAQRLKISRRLIDSWRERGTMPEPVCLVGNRPCWEFATLEEWYNQRSQNTKKADVA